MSKEDTNSIKYILEEMDPAEMVEFERMMASDPDLRIEVESIKRMTGKLNTLPKLSPPKQLTDSILSIAADQRGERGGFRSGYFLSAAVVILGLTSGFLVLQNISEESGQGWDSSASISAFGNGLNQIKETQNPSIKPWVDRQDVLRLDGFESVPSPIQVYEVTNSINKLKPVSKYPDIQPFSRSVQLTGNQR